MGLCRVLVEILLGLRRDLVGTWSGLRQNFVGTSSGLCRDFVGALVLQARIGSSSPLTIKTTVRTDHLSPSLSSAVQWTHMSVAPSDYHQLRK